MGAKGLDIASLDTTGALLRARRRAQLGLRLVALGFLLLLLWGGYLVYLMALLLKAPGWPQYLGTSSPPDALLACLGKGPCREALVSLPARLHRLPFWLPPLAALGMAVGGFLVYLRFRQVKPTKLPGAAKIRQDFQEFLQGISYLGLKNGKVLRYPKDLRFRHTLILGSTGAGKTSRIFRPMLAYTAKEGRSAVVVDLKYPDGGLLGMIPLFESYGRNVIVLLPYDPRSPRLPLLRGAEDDRIAQKLAEVIIPVQEREDVTSYYKHIERDFLQRLIQLEARVGTGSLGNIRYLCQQGPDHLRNYIDTHAPDTMKYFGFFFAMNKGDQARLVGGLVGKLSVFGDPLVDRFTSFGPGEVDLSVIAKEPTLVYLGIPQERVQDAGGQLLLQLFKRYLDWVLLEASAKTGSLEVPVEIYLDEFTNLGFLPRMSDNLSTMRSRKVAYILALQSYAQGLERYREEELESIIGNCNTHFVFPTALHGKDAKRISEELGNTTVFLEGEGVHTPHLLDLRNPWPTHSHNLRITELPLLSPEEMRNLDPSTVLVRFSSGDPMVVEIPRLDEVLHDPQAPKELKELATKTMEAEAKHRALAQLDAQLAADYLVSPYLIPIPFGEGAGTHGDLGVLGLSDTKERLFTWVLESIRGGADMRVFRNPNNPTEVTKLSIRPPAGLVPEEAKSWERTKWVKLEAGNSVVSLVGLALQEFLQAHAQLVEFADLLARLKLWVEDNAPRLQGHPLFQGDGEPLGRFQPPHLILPLSVLAEMGISPERAQAFGKQVRWENRRGYIALPLSLQHFFSEEEGLQEAQKGGD